MKTKRGFFRGLWGEIGGNNLRREKVSNDIKKCLANKNKVDFRVYVFGRDNFKICEDFGLDCVLVDDRPTVWDMDTEFYRHKLEIFNRASEDYDEFVFLDWDCTPRFKLIDPWGELGKKDVIQANLFQYRTKRCFWRSEDTRKVCNAGFVYFREGNIPSEIIKIWEDLRKMVMKIKGERGKRGLELRLREKCLIFDEEPSISKYIDDNFGGWKGEMNYYNLFEPKICLLRRNSPFPKGLIDMEKACFFHTM